MRLVAFLQKRFKALTFDCFDPSHSVVESQPRELPTPTTLAIVEGKKEERVEAKAVHFPASPDIVKTHVYPAEEGAVKTVHNKSQRSFSIKEYLLLCWLLQRHQRRPKLKRRFRLCLFRILPKLPGHRTTCRIPLQPQYKREESDWVNIR